MKIQHLLSGLTIAVTNEEQAFLNQHEGRISLNSLNDHDQWLAQNLVRKGVYSISKDNTVLVKNLDETANK